MARADIRLGKGTFLLTNLASILIGALTFNLDQNAPLCLQYLVTCVSHLLEPMPATMMTVAMVVQWSLHLFLTAAAASVKQTQSLVLLTRALDPDSGSQCTQRFALQMAVVVQVSGRKS